MKKALRFNYNKKTDCNTVVHKTGKLLAARLMAGSNKERRGVTPDILNTNAGTQMGPFNCPGYLQDAMIGNRMETA